MIPRYAKERVFRDSQMSARFDRSRDFSSIGTIRNNRSVSFRSGATLAASDFKVTYRRSYSRCFLSVYLHGTPGRSLSNEILAELVESSNERTRRTIPISPALYLPLQHG